MQYHNKLEIVDPADLVILVWKDSPAATSKGVDKVNVASARAAHPVTYAVSVLTVLLNVPSIPNL